MPTLAFPVAKHKLRIAFTCLSLLASLIAVPAAAQGFWMDSLSYYRYVEPVRMTLLLPADGPSASLLNPALLASAERGYADFGSWSGGESRSKAFSTGFGFGRRFYLGLFLSSSGNGFDNTNAVMLNNRLGAQVAYRHPLDAEGRGSLTLGIAEANRMVNSMSAFKAFSSTVDLGALWVPSTYPGGWRLELGWAARDLRPFSESIEWVDDGMRTNVHVDYAPWMTLASLAAESPEKQWMFYGGAAAGAKYEPAFFDVPLPGWNAGAFNFYLPRIGLRYRPLPMASVALERLWNRYWAAAATLGTGNWLRIRCEGELRAVHGPFLEYLMPETSGWSLAWNLRLHW